MLIKQDRFSVDLGETKIVWHMEIPIIVPLNFTHEQERYVKAALTTLHFGNISVDNILKRNFENYVNDKRKRISKSKENLNFKYDEFINQILKFQKQHFTEINHTLSKIDFTDEIESISFSGVIFKRLDSSFGAVRTLINQGFYFETYSILRQMVEQIAFAYDIFYKEKYEDFISPTKCITRLKEFYPSVGNFYGILSSKTHIDKTQIRNYYYIDDNENGQIILKSIEFSVDTALDFLVILDLYCCVFELIFNNQVSSIKHLTKKSLPKKSRTTRRFYYKIFEKYEKLKDEKNYLQHRV